MKKKLNRRELVQAGVVTGAAIALGGAMAAQPGPAEAESTAHIESAQGVLANIYQHVPDSCVRSWHNPACPGTASLWLSDGPPSGSPLKYPCSHNS